VTTRAQIVAQLGTATGTTPRVTPYTIPPAAPRAGDAWPRLHALERGHGDSWRREWHVLVALGPDPGLAGEHFESLVPAVLDVLDPVVYPSEVTFIEYEVNNVTVTLAAQIRCVAE
jgi:hypothetical protein